MPTFHGPDWFSQHIPNWKRWLARFQGRDGIRAVEIGTYEGRAACWLLDNVLTGRNCGRLFTQIHVQRLRLRLVFELVVFAATEFHWSKRLTLRKTAVMLLWKCNASHR
jgi:hypothetical protein